MTWLQHMIAALKATCLRASSAVSHSKTAARTFTGGGCDHSPRIYAISRQAAMISVWGKLQHAHSEKQYICRKRETVRPVWHL